MFRLLIADDESLERKAIKFIVNNNCAEIIEIEEASNGREAVEKALIFKPHIIILDIKMPGIDGIEAASRIKKLNPDIKIIFLTAFDYFEYAKEAIKIGVENFIIKPAEDEQIVEGIKNITDKLVETMDKKNEQSKYDDKFAKVTDFLESEIVSTLSIGEVNEGKIKGLLELMNIHSIKGGTAIIRIDSEGLQLEMLTKLYKNKIKDFMDQNNILCLINSVKSNLYIITFPKKEMELDAISEVMRSTYKKIYSEMNNHIKNKVSIGIGNSFNDIKGIYGSFSGAKVACARCEGSILLKHYDDVKKNENKSYQIEKEKILCEKIIICDEIYALAIYDEIMDLIEDSYELLEAEVLKVYELVVVINRSVASEIRKETLEVSFSDLQQIDSKIELRTFIRNYILKLIEEIIHLKSDSGAAVVDKICEHINKNYQEQISLDDLASMVGFSSFYFSKIFKMYKGINFIDYLTNVRISKGKELLKDNSISVKEVSELIGYNNADYFTRVFKRSEGLTPTEYRNRRRLTLS